MNTDNFMLMPRKKDIQTPWHELALGNIDIGADMGDRGLLMKAIQEKKTFRTSEISTTLKIDDLRKILCEDDNYYLAYLYSSEDQDIEVSDKYDGPEVVDKETPTYKAMFISNDGDSYIYFTAGKSYTEVKSYLSIASTDEVKIINFKLKFKPFKATIKKKEEGFVHMMLSSREEISIQKTGKISSPINREYYSKEVQESFDFIISEFKKPVPKGKITILSGPPGTGKTYLIRSLITAGSDFCSFVIVPPSLVSKLGEPEMLPSLLAHKNEKKPLVLILEDADILVKERMKDSIDAISAALNMGDGILGDVCNIRLVITTNQPITEVDEAMKRPGRLSCSCVVGDLNKSEIEIAWKKIAGDKEMPQELKDKESSTLAKLFQYKAELDE